MSQNQLIAVLFIILVAVIMGSIIVLLSASEESSLPAVEAPVSSADSQHLFPLDIIERQAYQLLNKQLVKEGALPVQPPVGAGKANPFI